MRNSLSTLAFILIVALMIGCGGPTYIPQQQAVVVPPPTDPCAPSYFNEMACSMAINSGGYWHYGQFMAYPVGFNRSLIYYQGGYNRWVSSGNRPIIINYNAPEYTRTYQRPPSVRYSDTPQATTTQRATTPTRDTGTGSFQSPATRQPVTTQQYSTPVAAPGSQRATTPTRNQSPVATPSYSQQSPTNRYSTPATRYSSASQQSSPSVSTSLSSTRSTTATRPSSTSVSSSSRSTTSSTTSSSSRSSAPTRR